MSYIFIEKRYSINEVLNFYTPHKIKKDYDGELIKMNSQRYQVFKEKGCVCIDCGREGTHFRLQRNYATPTFHFGLWSDDDVQITKDHIIPKSRDGRNAIENYQTM